MGCTVPAGGDLLGEDPRPGMAVKPLDLGGGLLQNRIRDSQKMLACREAPLLRPVAPLRVIDLIPW